jgi:hypothetical protein
LADTATSRNKTVNSAATIEAALLVTTMLHGSADAQTDLKQALKDSGADHWIYDDLDQGFARAKETGQPMMVVFR